MTSAVPTRLSPPRLTLACAGVLLAGVLAPRAVLAQYSAPQAPGDGLTPYADPAFGPEAGPGCLQARKLSGVAVSNDREVTLRFGTAFYRVGLTRDCPALVQRGAHVAGITRSTGGLICRPFDVELKIVAGDGAVSYCTGGALHKMSKAEVAATPAPAHR